MAELKTLFPRHDGKPSRLGTMQRIGDAEGLLGDADLATPIGTTQDGPRMTTPHFGSKKAAPFVKGGGRSKTHPNDATGKRRAKVLAAKKAVAKARVKDYSTTTGADIDLGLFHGRDVTSEPRGANGRWIRAAMRAGTQKERNAVRSGAMADYQSFHTSNEEHNMVLDVLDKADKAARVTKSRSPHTIKKHKRIAAMRALQRQQDSSVGADVRADRGKDLSHDVSKESRDRAGMWTKMHDAMQLGAPLSKAHSSLLAAKNDLAEAEQGGHSHKINRAKRKLAKAKMAWDQEQTATETAGKLAANHARMAGYDRNVTSTGMDLPDYKGILE